MSNPNVTFGFFPQSVTKVVTFAAVSASAIGYSVPSPNSAQRSSPVTFSYRAGGESLRPPESERLWLQRLRELADLPTGWLDGDGTRLSVSAEHAALSLLTAVESARLPMPGIFPTEHGGLEMEWMGEREVISVTVTSEGATEAEYLDLGSMQTQSEDIRAAGDLLRFLAIRRMAVAG